MTGPQLVLPFSINKMENPHGIRKQICNILLKALLGFKVTLSNSDHSPISDLVVERLFRELGACYSVFCYLAQPIPCPQPTLELLTNNDMPSSQMSI